MAFDFFQSEIVYSNLGGLGPDTSSPSGIRFANVGGATVDGVGTFRFDLVVTARSAYTASDPSLNGLNGRFAQINFSANSQVSLRVTVHRSCCSTPNCAACEAASLSTAERNACYARGCCCFGTSCTLDLCCTGAAREAHRAGYGCAGSADALVLPSTSLVGFSIYDLDGGANGEYTERVIASDYAYYVSPLRPSSGEAVVSTLGIDRNTGTFESTAKGTPADNPLDPHDLTEEQAARSVQLFFRPSVGYVDSALSWNRWNP